MLNRKADDVLIFGVGRIIFNSNSDDAILGGTPDKRVRIGNYVNDWSPAHSLGMRHRGRCALGHSFLLIGHKNSRIIGRLIIYWASYIDDKWKCKIEMPVVDGDAGFLGRKTNYPPRGSGVRALILNWIETNWNKTGGGEG